MPAFADLDIVAEAKPNRTHGAGRGFRPLRRINSAKRYKAKGIEPSIKKA
jgi:hypothetical protein